MKAEIKDYIMYCAKGLVIFNKIQHKEYKPFPSSFQ